MSNKYILDGKTPVQCDDIMTWGKWFQSADRHINRTKQNDVLVSTVFLGLDHSFGDGPPQLFETMVFRGEDEEGCERCSTWEEAEAQHEKMCAEVFK